MSISKQKLTFLPILLALWAAAPGMLPAQSSARVAAAARIEKPDADSDLRIHLASVQVVLDRAGFRPGKIDGLGGEFTQKAADRLNQARGLPPGTLVDTSGLSSPYRYYDVTEEDLKWIGKTASSPPEQQKLKRMPYADAWEMVAEMFHCDLDFVRELNPSLANVPIVAGTSVRVPDVEPFRMADVTALEKSRSEAAKAAVNPSPTAMPTPTNDLATDPTDLSSPPLTQSAQSEFALAPEPTPDFLLGNPNAQVVDPIAPTPTPEPPKRRIVLLTGPRILELYEGDRLIASYPCTPGSGRVPVPVGEWRITANILMPYFRYDKSVLKDGTRSDNAFNIPPGPNNYVGIVWMAINRPSVGIHGTQSPDQIGRNESSGCIRLANWDAFDLSQKITKGTPVTVLRNAEATP
ncbi:MAG: L,D-transpeptidase family protein [Chthoniobacterales bacterium]